MKILNSQPAFSNSMKRILYPHMATVKRLVTAILVSGTLVSQVSIKNDLIFMKLNSDLFHFSTALYPGRVGYIPSLEGASEIAPTVIKEMGYNLIITNDSVVLLNYKTNDIGITVLKINTEFWKIIEWQSGKIVD